MLPPIRLGLQGSILSASPLRRKQSGFGLRNSAGREECGPRGQRGLDVEAGVSIMSPDTSGQGPGGPPVSWSVKGGRTRGAQQVPVRLQRAMPGTACTERASDDSTMSLSLSCPGNSTLIRPTKQRQGVDTTLKLPESSFPRPRTCVSSERKPDSMGKRQNVPSHLCDR